MKTNKQSIYKNYVQNIEPREHTMYRYCGIALSIAGLGVALSLLFKDDQTGGFIFLPLFPLVWLAWVIMLVCGIRGLVSTVTILKDYKLFSSRTLLFAITYILICIIILLWWGETSYIASKSSF